MPGRLTVSRQTCFTSGAVAFTMSRSACSRTTFFPARCPPGCSLVCCGQQMTTLLPNASNPCTRTPRKLLPYAISKVTVAIPHTMPSIVRKLRVRFRFSAIQASRMISSRSKVSEFQSFKIQSFKDLVLSSRLIPQRLDRINRRGSTRRIQCRSHRNRSQQTSRNQSRTPTGQQSRKKIGHRQQVHESAEAEGHTKSDSPAQQSDDEGLNKELPQNRRRGCSNRLAHSNLSRAFAHCDQHHVHHSNAAEKERHYTYGSQEKLHPVGHRLEGLRFLHRIPDRARFLVVRVVAMHAGEGHTHFVFAGIMLLDRFRRHQQLVKSRICSRWFIGKIAPHRRKRHEHLVHVPAVVAGVLLLLRHHANHGIGKIVQINRISHWIAAGKQLLCRVRPEECHAPGLAHVVPIIETS